MMAFWEDYYKQIRDNGNVGVMTWEKETHPADYYKKVESILPESSGHVLDYGCGLGHWHDFFVNHGYAYYGYDIATVAIEEACRRYPDSVFFKDYRTAENMDVIFCHFVLMHVMKDDDVIALLKSFKPLLSDNGYVVVIDNTSGKPPKDYINFRTVPIFERLFTKADLHIVQAIPSKAYNGEDINLWRLTT